MAHGTTTADITASTFEHDYVQLHLHDCLQTLPTSMRCTEASVPATPKSLSIVRLHIHRLDRDGFALLVLSVVMYDG
jgi:hypothetical protein